MIRVHTEVEVNAPPDIIWDILTDFPQYESWNPFIVAARGDAWVGSSVFVRIAPPGLKESAGHVRITELRRLLKLRWLGQWFRTGLFNGDHILEIAPIENNRSRVIHAEVFGGILAPCMAYWLKRNLRRGFEEMNWALKARAESVCARSA